MPETTPEQLTDAATASRNTAAAATAERADSGQVPEDLIEANQTPTRRTVVPVTGMTCGACETRVQKVTRRLPGVVDARASSARGRLEIWSTDGVDLAAVRTVLDGAGYELGRPRWFSRDAGVWRTLAWAVPLVLALLLLAQWAGLSRLSAGIGDLADGGLVLVALLGLAAGVSTCMALTGGLVLAFSAAHAARLAAAGVAQPSAVRRLRPHLVFNAGRILGFAALGALLGSLGANITLPTQALAVLMGGVALVMALLGLRLTEVSPRLAGWTLTLPASVADRLGLDRRTGSGYSDARTALVGAATFFLPCGFTQAAQVYALSTGSPVAAATIMGVFALGTAPGLLVLGGLPELVPAQARTVLLRVLGVVVLGFAVLNAQSAMRLAGIELRPPAPVAAVSGNVIVTAGMQTMTTDQVTDGYLPVENAVHSGMPIRWVIDSHDATSCAVALRVPAWGVSVTLHAGQNVLDIPAQQPGRIAFSCSMGMYGGHITVLDN